MVDLRQSYEFLVEVDIYANLHIKCCLIVGKVRSMLRCITKTRGEASGLAKKALSELDLMLGHFEALGNDVVANLAPGLLYSFTHFQGVMFQVALETRKSKRKQLDVLAAGGRYDGLVRLPTLSTQLLESSTI